MENRDPEGLKEVLNADQKIVIDSVEVLKETLELNQLEGRWYYKGKPYSGYALKLHANDTLGEKLGFHNGKREGLAQQWSENGVLRIESYYSDNKLDKFYRTWWENGVLASVVIYENGKKQGMEKQWYPDGTLAKQRMLVEGKESGLQKAWLPNGVLYVNYEALNGRIFGMRRANSCYQLDDEKIIEYDEL
ncbi:toxin-antitoxin system YwqK family antitoxin [Christiangramia marina]|uniref:toxin-antitoxin system YwqK family antitoxin n=1 Tax=Christiangramia marina TaxID=409436 RepID=UPI003AA81C34